MKLKAYKQSGVYHLMNNGAVQTRKQTSKYVADFIQKLKTTNDIYANPLIDSTLVVYGCEMGHASNHNSKDIPFIMAGAGLQGGRFLEYQDENWNRVLVSICHILGDSISQYGSYGSYTSGPLKGLA